MFLKKKKNDYELFFDNIIQLKFNLPPPIILNSCAWKLQSEVNNNKKKMVRIIKESRNVTEKRAHIHVKENLKSRVKTLVRNL